VDIVNFTRSLFSGMLLSIRMRFGQQPCGQDKAARFRRLVALEVIEQVCNLPKALAIQSAGTSGLRLMIHVRGFDLASRLRLGHDAESDGHRAIHGVRKLHRVGSVA
jgi:hypothetical protein